MAEDLVKIEPNVKAFIERMVDKYAGFMPKDAENPQLMNISSKTSKIQGSITENDESDDDSASFSSSCSSSSLRSDKSDEGLIKDEKFFQELQTNQEEQKMDHLSVKHTQ